MPLLTPAQVGSVTTQHRIVMAPLTRFRANDDFTPSSMQEEYYTQRSSIPGTLLISEATYISKKSGGYYNVPGIWNQDQIDGWKKIANAIHKNGCHMFMQLWTLGRVAQSSRFDSYITSEDGFDLIGPSPIADHTDEETSIPREMTKEEIDEYINDYVNAAKNAVFKAGMDGIEIQSGNGYLLDQFLHGNSNKRTDEYGGSIENRSRFLLKIIDALIDVIGAGKIGLRLSPWEDFQGMDPTISPMRTYGYVLMQLEARAKENSANRLAYVHIVEPSVKRVFKDVPKDEIEHKTNEWVRTFWSGLWIKAGGFTRERALTVCSKDKKVMVAFGRRFIANPDLVKRFVDDLPLNRSDVSTYYKGGEKGYIDYPFTPTSRRTSSS